MRLFLGSAIVCVSTWLALAFGAGYVGLSRAVSDVTRLAEHPAALVAVALVGFVTSLAVTRRFRLRPLLLLLGVLVGDAFAADVLAPIAIGELEVSTGVPVFLEIAVAGLQPAAVLLGSCLGTQGRSQRSTPAGPAT